MVSCIWCMVCVSWSSNEIALCWLRSSIYRPSTKWVRLSGMNISKHGRCLQNLFLAMITYLRLANTFEPRVSGHLHENHWGVWVYSRILVSTEGCLYSTHAILSASETRVVLQSAIIASRHSLYLYGRLERLIFLWNQLVCEPYVCRY